MRTCAANRTTDHKSTVNEYGIDWTSLPTQAKNWDNAIELAHLIDGYELLAQQGVDNGFAFADERLAHAKTAGAWSGAAHELWICLFLEYRRWKFAGADPRGEDRVLVDILCRQLAEALHG